MELLEQHVDTAFAAPDGIAKLRELILTLAMQGKLVEQNPNDPPASELLKKIEAEKRRLVKAGKIKQPRPLPPIKPDEVPYELPQGWEWVRLGEVSSYIQRGKGPQYADFSTHRVISQKCVRWYGLDLEPARYIDPASLEKYEPIRFLREGDLLWNSTGTGTIGRACLVPQEIEDEEIVADSHVTVVRRIEISPLFLWRWIQSPMVQNEIEGSASGTTNPIELNTSTVINHLMPLPSLSEQHRIVAKIDQLMARCDELEKLRTNREQQRLAVHAAAIRQLLDAPDGSVWDFIRQHFAELYSVKENVAELRKAILQLAVMGKLVPQDRNDPPARELLKEIETEKQRLVKAGKIKQPKPLPPIKPEEVPFPLPQGWEWVRLGSLSPEFQNGISKRGSSDGRDTIVLRLADIVGNEVSLEDTRSIRLNENERSKYLLKDRDILITRVNGSVDLVGSFIRVRRHTQPFTYCDHFIRMQLPKNFIDVDYLHTISKGAFIRRQIEGKFVTTAGQKTVNQTHIATLVLPLPPFPEQHRIVARVDQLMTLCDTLDQKLDAATSKQTELLNAMMAHVNEANAA
jgi:type I restriction enzyme S subunit